MKISAHKREDTPELSLAPLNWVQYRILAIETLLLMALFIVLGVLRLDYSAGELWKACYEHVPLLVTFLVVFGGYRTIEATNAVKLFTSYVLSFLAAGAMFLMCVPLLSGSHVDYRFDIFYVFIAFFMLNCIRPLLLHCTEF